MQQLRSRLGVLVACGVAVVLAFLIWPREAPRVAPPPPGMPAPPAELPFIEHFDVPAARPDDAAQRERFRARMGDAYDHYLAFSAFPPWSRPADGSQTHLWQWNPPRDHAQVIATDGEGREVHARVELDRMFAGPGDTLQATATAWIEGPGGAHVAVPFTASGEVRVWDKAAAEAALASHRTPMVAAGLVAAGEPIAFAADAADPAVQRATLAPASLAALRDHPRDAHFVALISAAGHTMPFTLSFQYAAARPLRVLGAADALVDGSLVVTLDVEADEPGRTLVQATLFSGDGVTPIAVFDDYRTLARAGRQPLEITFYGRALHDAGLDGPYVIRATHGRMVSGAGEVFWDAGRELATAAYHASAFTDEEWWSEDRAQKVAQYEAMLNELGDPAGATPSRDKGRP